MFKLCALWWWASMALLCGSGMAVETKPPDVETRPASSLGTTGLTLVGRIQPRGLPTRYRFEYGLTPALGQSTEPQPLPGRLAAYYREDWNHGLGLWKGGMSGNDLTYQTDPASQSGFARYSEPSGHDPNHVDGIGTLHLCKYHYPGGLGRSFWGGGDPDLRDARVRLRVRGQEWVPRGSELVWWTQSDKLLEEQTTKDWRRANWAYTGETLTDKLQTGQWEDVDYRLWNDPHRWTYAGNNLAQKRPNYEYWSIQESQAHLNADFFHLLAFVDPQQPPTGSIDFDDFEVTYRNHSLLLPSNGGSLTASPAGSDDSPATLTDGWRHGPGRQWTSGPSPASPLEFTWKFATDVTIETLQIHQHSEWPARDVEVLVRTDGTAWSPIWAGRLPENAPDGPNFAFALKQGLSVPAKEVLVRVLSGYRSERWGLGEVELFGTGAIEATDDDDYFVNADLADLTPGATYHYRIVAENAQGTFPGAVQTWTVPGNARPLVESRTVSRVSSTTADMVGRVNALGLRTEFWVEYGSTPDLGQFTPRAYAGLQLTPRDAIVALPGLSPATTYYYRFVAENADGQTSTPVAQFTTLDAAN